MEANGTGRIRFGSFELDPQAGKLFRNGQPVKIQPQPLRVLGVLVERPGEIVSRETLHARVWGNATFVEFNQGLNYCIRQIRLALPDDASEPLFIETLPKQGYRFIAPVTTDCTTEDKATAAPIVEEAIVELEPQGRVRPAQKLSTWSIAAGVCAVFVLGGVATYSFVRSHPPEVRYTQVTDFTDSAVAPALSPVGGMVAFIRGSRTFGTADQIYVKVLPNGEAKRLTDDRRLKYNLAFSPDGSEIAYTVMEAPNWSTYTVSVLGGDSHLLLNNAAGLTWLDQHQFLFSQTRSGQHMGIVTGTATRAELHELYFPAHERAMAHYSYASPDRKWALVVEMDEKGEWAPCRIISMHGPSQNRPIGPQGACLSAGWSPDGSWMYFAAVVEKKSHLWRQRFPNGQPEQITFGPTEEGGLAVDPDGRSLITSMGAYESAIWIHDAYGERPLSSEGQVIAGNSPPTFSSDDKLLYFLLRRGPADSGTELRRMMVQSGTSEAVFPGISMLAFDVSPDGKQVVYSTVGPGGKSNLWLAPMDRSSPAKRIGSSDETSPHFGPHGQVLFQLTEGKFNYLEQMNQDGSGRSKVVPYPISEIQGVSPNRRWVMAIAPLPDGSEVVPMAIPVDGGPPRIICAIYCLPQWSPSGKYIFVPVESPSLASPGRSLAIPVGPGESLPAFPPGGIKPLAEASVMPGSQSVQRAELVPGMDPSHFAYVNTTVHRNLYRISLP